MAWRCLIWSWKFSQWLDRWLEDLIILEHLTFLTIGLFFRRVFIVFLCPHMYQVLHRKWIFLFQNYYDHLDTQYTRTSLCSQQIVLDFICKLARYHSHTHCQDLISHCATIMDPENNLLIQWTFESHTFSSPVRT